MPKAEKIERVAELKAGIEGSDALLLTEYRGLTVSDITELRRSLAEGGTRFAVVKNTLMQRAAADASIDELESLLEGPTAVAFIAGDPVAAAKKVVEAAKKFPSLILKGGYMDGKVLSADEAKGLADLEPREVMLSKIAGLLKGEMSRAASMFVAAQSKFLSLLEAYKEKVPDDSVPEVAEEVVLSAEPAASSAEPAEAEEAPSDEAPSDEVVDETPAAVETSEDAAPDAEAATETEGEE
ncbi:MAG: 50S ribosomal protein L10 [Actinomycetota bacterium]